jgi:hypothetical protein
MLLNRLNQRRIIIADVRPIHALPEDALQEWIVSMRANKGGRRRRRSSAYRTVAGGIGRRRSI